MNEAIKFDEPTTCNVAFFCNYGEKKDKYNNCRIKYSTEISINKINQIKNN